MGILETTFDQIAEHFAAPGPSSLYGRVYRGRLIRKIDIDNEWFFQRTDGRFGGKGESYADCVRQIDEEIAEDEFADASPRNRGPLTAAEQRRDEFEFEAANDRATGRGGF